MNLKIKLMYNKKSYSENKIPYQNSGNNKVLSALLSDMPDEAFKPAAKTQKFRLNRKDVFLTYSQIKPSMDPKWFLNRLKGLELGAEIDEYCIAREPHKKGGHHVHIYIKFEEKVDIKNANAFDLYYYMKAYHPNVTGPKYKDRVLNYITKGKEFIKNFDVRPEWKQILDESEDYEDFYNAILLAGNSYKSYIGWRALEKLFDIKYKTGLGKNRTAESMKGFMDKWKQHNETDTVSLNKE